MYIKFKDEQGNINLQKMNITAMETFIRVDKKREVYYEMYNYNQPLAKEFYEVISTLDGENCICTDCLEEVFSKTQINFNECVGLLPNELDAFMKAIQEALERGDKLFDVTAWNRDCLDKMRNYIYE